MPEMEPGLLRWKRVYDPPQPGDGFRALIDRLWPRGLKKESACWDAWWKDLAPGAELRRWFRHDPERWDEFRRRYARELDAQPAAIAGLLCHLRHGPVTLLTAAARRDCNHAAALLEYIRATRTELV